jgi:hypothetical protein
MRKSATDHANCERGMPGIRMLRYGAFFPQRLSSRPRHVPSATFYREDAMLDCVSNARESCQKADNIYRHNSRRRGQGCPGQCDLADQLSKPNKLRAGFRGPSKPA